MPVCNPLQHFRLLVVCVLDDPSSGAAPVIVGFADRDHRFKCRVSPPGTVAWNFGAEIAQGRYLMFRYAEDTIFPRYAMWILSCLLYGRLPRPMRSMPLPKILVFVSAMFHSPRIFQRPEPRTWWPICPRNPSVRLLHWRRTALCGCRAHRLCLRVLCPGSSRRPMSS